MPPHWRLLAVMCLVFLVPFGAYTVWWCLNRAEPIDLVLALLMLAMQVWVMGCIAFTGYLFPPWRARRR